MIHNNRTDADRQYIALFRTFSTISLTILILIVFPVDFAQSKTTLTATLDRTSMTVDETAELNITIDGASASAPDIPEVEGLHISRTGQSRQIRIINGSTSSTLTLSYLIEARHPGLFVIPAIEVTIDGKKLTSEAIPLEVRSVSSIPPSPEQETNDQIAGHQPEPMLKIAIKRQCYVGERVPATIKAYFPAGQGASVNKLPTVESDGLVMEQVDSKPQQTVERLEGVDYNVLTWNSTLVGIKVGHHPLYMQLGAILSIANRPRSLSPFGADDPFSDELLGQFFGNVRKKPIVIGNAPMELEILPLPAKGQPPGFSGAIGTFSLQTSAIPKDIDIGEPLSLTMTITGKGNFETLKAPELPPDSRWKSYTPSSRFIPDGSSFHGQKIFEQAIVITDPLTKELPPISFSFFDPDRREYVTASSSPIPLAIHRATTATTPLSSPAGEAIINKNSQDSARPHASGETSANGLDLAPQREQAGDLSDSIAPLFTRTWFLVTTGLCLLAIAVFLLVITRRRWSADTSEQEKKVRIWRHLEEAVGDIEAAIAAQDSNLFLSLCRSTIQQQLAMRWQLAPETITCADLAARLDPVSPLHEILTAAEKNAFAGHRLTPNEMRNYAENLQQELSRLQ